MARQALTDNLWEQLQVTIKNHCCYQKEKNREVNRPGIVGNSTF